MQQFDDQSTLVKNPVEVASLVDVLMALPAAFILLDITSAQPLPVIVDSKNENDNSLLINISSAREVLSALKSGTGFSLVGYRDGAMLKSAVLKMSSLVEQEGRLLCGSGYPDFFEILQRRDVFRAELRSGVECLIAMVSEGERLHGSLKDLSLLGCLVELPLQAGAAIEVNDQPLELSLCFPDSTHFFVEAELRHVNVYLDHRYIHIGFEFSNLSTQQQPELNYFVNEIERECARREGRDSRLAYAPSPLFQQNSTGKNKTISNPGLGRFIAPMARRLAELADFLSGQILILKSGGVIDSVQLSRCGDKLLKMMEDDREAVLFALSCINGYQPLIRHCLAVAVRLVDIYDDPGVHRGQLKAIAACGMVHDLGECLLPLELRKAAKFEPAQQGQLAGHVEVLVTKLGECHWLSPRVVDEVIVQINERLDGTGYPKSSNAESLNEFARLAAVVNAVDAMGRDCADHKALPIDAIYRQLLINDSQFDQGLVKRYVGHFGVLPIGALIRYENDQLAWVQSLSSKGLPDKVQLTEKAEPPTVTSLGDILEGSEIDVLGKVVEIITPSGW